MEFPDDLRLRRERHRDNVIVDLNHRTPGPETGGRKNDCLAGVAPTGLIGRRILPQLVHRWRTGMIDAGVLLPQRGHQRLKQTEFAGAMAGRPRRSLATLRRPEGIRHLFRFRESQLLQEFSGRVPFDSGFLKVIVIRPERQVRVKGECQDIDIVWITLRY